MNDHYIPVRLNDDGDRTEALQEAYNIEHIPTLLLVQPDGNEIDRIVDLANYRNRFLDFLKNALEGKNTVVEIRRSHEKNPDAVELQYRLFKKYVRRGDLEGMMSIGKKILRQESSAMNIPDTSGKRQRGLFEETEHAIRTTLNRSSKADMLRYFSDFPDIRFSEKAYRFIARAYADSGESEEANAFFKRAIRDYPRSSQLQDIFVQYRRNTSDAGKESHEKK